MTTVSLHGSNVLVTGGTGSFGHRVAMRLRGSGVRSISIFSRDEKKQYEMRLEHPDFHYILGDTRDADSVESAMSGIDIVFHAAALKQVPNCEAWPMQAVATNVLGSNNVFRAARRAGVKAVVALSTDKAVKPVNAMGMTKALMEKVVGQFGVQGGDTVFSCVRYGNVLASRGSVIPLFHEQILNGGPVTITTEDMTRFLLPLDRGVDTIFAAIEGGKPGETWVPLVPAARIVDVARALIGGRNVPVKVTGIRPGEKVHEILFSDEEAVRTTRRGEYYAIRPMLPELAKHDPKLEYQKKEYSSGDEILSAADTAALLKRHELLLEQRDLAEAGEVLR